MEGESVKPMEQQSVSYGPEIQSRDRAGMLGRLPWPQKELTRMLRKMSEEMEKLSQEELKDMVKHARLGLSAPNSRSSKLMLVTLCRFMHKTKRNSLRLSFLLVEMKFLLREICSMQRTGEISSTSYAQMAEVEMDRGKSLLEEQVLRIDSTFTPKMEAEAVMYTGTSLATKAMEMLKVCNMLQLKLEKWILEPHSILSNKLKSYSLSDGDAGKLERLEYFSLPYDAAAKLDRLESCSFPGNDDDADGSGHDENRKEVEIDGGGKSLSEEQVMGLPADEIDTEQVLKDMVNKLYTWADPGDQEEDEMDRALSDMEEQVPRIDSKFESEMEVQAIIGSDMNEAVTDFSVFQSDKSILESDPVPSNIMPRPDHYLFDDDDDKADDPIHHNIMPRPDFSLFDDDDDDDKADNPIQYNIMPRLEKQCLLDDDEADGSDEEMDRGKSAAQLAMEAEVTATEEENFVSHRIAWEFSRGKSCGSFKDMTAVSSMQFTHLTPGRIPCSDVVATATLQIFSIKLTKIKGGFKWPLSVYGEVAVRDTVDYNRNLLFCCDRSKSQQLNQDEPFLLLIGPSRAIVFTDAVDFEFQLKVKGRAKTRDRALISDTCHYSGGRGPGVSTISFENCFCKTELCLEKVGRTVQATILSVQVVKAESWPFEYGGQVTCCSPSQTAVITDSEVTYVTNPRMQVVLLDSRNGKMPVGKHGYLHLSRQVVSVEIQGSLEVAIEAYSKSGDIAAKGCVSFMPEECNISQDTCALGDAEVKVTVAWSLLVTDKHDIAAHIRLFEASQLYDKD